MVSAELNRAAVSLFVVVVVVVVVVVAALTVWRCSVVAAAGEEEEEAAERFVFIPSPCASDEDDWEAAAVSGCFPLPPPLVPLTC
jgi:hypothetical protein